MNCPVCKKPVVKNNPNQVVFYHGKCRKLRHKKWQNRKKVSTNDNKI